MWCYRSSSGSVGGDDQYQWWVVAATILVADGLTQKSEHSHQGGVGIRMPDQRSVGRSSYQAWKKKKDFTQKKVLEVHTTQWAHKSLVDQRRILKQLVYSLFYQKKIHSSAFVVFMWTQIQFMLHSASRMCVKQMSMSHCKPCITDKTCRCSSHKGQGGKLPQ